jgi:hypothetical protein
MTVPSSSSVPGEWQLLCGTKQVYNHSTDQAEEKPGESEA